MPSLFFVVPCHGRLEKTRVCLNQLARTCASLEYQGISATAIVVARDENIETARELGFGIVKTSNHPLGKKWNDGYQYAGELGADYVVPLGSDDWVDPIIFTDLPSPTEIRCHRLSSVVREDGLRISALRIWYDGGDGVRIIPRNLLERLGWRPAEDHRDRAIDTSMMRRLQRLRGGATIRYFDANPYQIVDWKSADEQLNTYHSCIAFRCEREQDVWQVLDGRYPAESLADMRAVYGLPNRVAA